MASKNETNHFSLAVLANSFESGLAEDDDVMLDNFIQGYHELNKLLCSLGKIFYFVSKDVVDKMHILTKHMNNDSTTPHYERVGQMLKYEKENSIIGKKASLPSGSRTLLRLHRALLFMVHMMERLCEETDTPLSTLVHESYNKSLAEHHPWAVRKTVGLAVYALPSKAHFVQNLADNQPGGPQPLDQCREELTTRVVPSMRSTYDRIQKFYVDHDMLSLS